MCIATMVRREIVTVPTNALANNEPALEVIELRPTRGDINLRLDRFVASGIPDLSRTYLQSLVENGLVLVDGVARRPAFKMTPGQVVTVSLPEIETVEVKPENIPLHILFEDEEVVVIDKQAGMVVHPAPGHASGTLVNAVLYHAPAISIGGSNRPGIVHRLDKDTSGVMIVAKTDRARNSLVEQWKNRTVEKSYIALVAGILNEEEAFIDAPIGRDPANRMRMAAVRTGREARTAFRVIERFEDSSLLDVTIETGRTHQIRVHLAMIGAPVVGDSLYGSPKSARVATQYGVRRQFLHAATLGIEMTDGSRRSFSAPLAGDLLAALALVRAANDIP